MVDASRPRPALLLAATVLSLAACASSGHLPGPDRIRTWPPPPERPRIGLLGEIRGPADLGLRAGFMARVLGVGAASGDRLLRRPYAVAVAGNRAGLGPGGKEAEGPELLAVSDTETKVVQLFDLARGRVTTISRAGKTRLRSPVGLAFDTTRRLYVSDSSLGLLVRYTSGGAFDRILSRGLRRPSGLAIDRSRGVLYVSDTAEHTVRRFGLDGTPRGAFKIPFRFPTHLFVDRKGRLVISDSMNFRVVVLSPRGKLLATTGRRAGDASGDLMRPKGVALDAQGHLYVVDALFDNVQIFDPAGRLLLAFGAAGNGPGEFALPAGIAIDERDLIYVADSFNGRVQLFRFLGKETR